MKRRASRKVFIDSNHEGRYRFEFLRTYEIKIQQREYKNVESALGNLYRAKREGKISLQTRDDLIALAKAIYAEKRVEIQKKGPVHVYANAPVVIEGKHTIVQIIRRRNGFDIKIRDKKDRKE